MIKISWEKQKDNQQKCQPPTGKYPYKRSLILPYRSDYSFECFTCLKDTKQLNSLWKFLSFYESRLYNIGQVQDVDKEKLIEIDKSTGTLTFRKLRRSGTFYCIYQSKILAMYRVTILRNIQQKTLRYILNRNDSNRQMIDEKVHDDYFVIHENGPKLQIFFQLLYETSCNENRHYSYGQTVYVCMIRIADDSANETLAIHNKNEPLLITKLKEFHEIPCEDPLAERVVDANFQQSSSLLKNIRVVIAYKICQNIDIQQYRRAESETIAFMQIRSMFQSSEHIKRKIKEYTVITCYRFNQSLDLQKITPIRWNKIRFDYDLDELYHESTKPAKELSQWISPFYLEHSTNGRIFIDWFGNIHIKSLQKFDLRLIFRCYNDSSLSQTESKSKSKLNAIRIIKKHWHLPSLYEILGFYPQNDVI
uniref:Uncharacterized protein LOC113790920 n=1 Tax=Dermatophagoides pteronyssinus TaxID=6956 RepID=A0A6P6XSS5_DERPT|nr:uncharacterized protein LOC113790920 [Dermatophagoides pteronyssinus]